MMKTKHVGEPEGFRLLNENECCAVSGGMSSSNIDEDLAYMLGELLGKAFRALYDIGCNLVGKMSKTRVAVQ